MPLLRGAVENLAERGLPGALTGPASRGDAEVVRRQARALRGDAAEAYRLLSRRLVRIALRGGLERAPGGGGDGGGGPRHVAARGDSPDRGRAVAGAISSSGEAARQTYLLRLPRRHARRLHYQLI